MNKYVNEPETTPKASQNVLELFQCFVSHVRASEIKHCFGFVLGCFVSVVTAALHVKQNTETIPERFGIVLELFKSCFSLINLFIHVLKNLQIPKQFQRCQPITDDHTRITLY